jgi:death on curing protein
LGIFLIRGIVTDHPYVDGNKRTAMLAGLALLQLNDLHFTAKPSEIEDFAVKIATEKLDVPAIILWLRERIKVS